MKSICFNSKGMRGLNLVAALALMVPVSAYSASPSGSEFDTTMTPAAGGMMGVASAKMSDPVAAIFNNPATLTQQAGNNAFAIGATYGRLDLRANSDGVTPVGFTGPVDGDTELRDIALPHFAATQRLGPKFVAAMGITGLSGLGSDFRNTPNLPGNGVTSDLKLFGAAMTGAYQVNDQLSVGASFLIGLGSFQAGLFANTASTNSTGFGAQYGVTYDAGPITIGGSFRTEIFLNFEEAIETSGGVLNSWDLEQPRQTTLGFATNEGVLPNTTFAFEWRWKNYDDAFIYQDFWQDQHTFSFGIEHDLAVPVLKEIQLRAGYRFATEIAKDNEDLGNTVGGLGTVNVPAGGPTANFAFPIDPQFINLFQATAANGGWQHAVSAGVGAQILPNMRADMYASISLDAEAQYGLFRANQEFVHMGFGLTWNF